MSDDAIEPGSVLHWAGFEFDDGDTADKFFVVVGAQGGRLGGLIDAVLPPEPNKPARGEAELCGWA
ncbi:hypothetical protein AB7M17_005256 [Bradyrhizobium sp. USDA 377]